jgi:hypothetical protein
MDGLLALGETMQQKVGRRDATPNLLLNIQIQQLQHTSEGS